MFSNILNIAPAAQVAISRERFAVELNELETKLGQGKGEASAIKQAIKNASSRLGLGEINSEEKFTTELLKKGVFVQVVRDRQGKFHVAGATVEEVYVSKATIQRYFFDFYKQMSFERAKGVRPPEKLKIFQVKDHIRETEGSILFRQTGGAFLSEGNKQLNVVLNAPLHKKVCSDKSLFDDYLSKELGRAAAIARFPTLSKLPFERIKKISEGVPIISTRMIFESYSNLAALQALEPISEALNRYGHSDKLESLHSNWLMGTALARFVRSELENVDARVSPANAKILRALDRKLQTMIDHGQPVKDSELATFLQESLKESPGLQDQFRKYAIEVFKSEFSQLRMLLEYNEATASKAAEK